MFLGRFTEEEQADYDKKRDAARKEIDAKYADEIATKTARREAAIKAAKQAKDKDAKQQPKAELLCQLWGAAKHG